MMIKTELVKKIKDYFGLNIYETKVWLALLSKGVASAGEIAELSGVPRSRTYDVLESLEKQGFAIEKIGKPVKYIAVKPTAIVEKLKTNTLNDAQEKVKTLSSLKQTKEYTELEELHKTGMVPVKQQEISGAIRGKINLYSQIREMLENSEKEVIISMPASELENKNRVFNGMFERLKKSNIKIKIALSGTEEEIKKVEDKFKFKASKMDIKSKFFISDRKQALFIITNSPEDEQIGIWIDSDFFASSLAYLFELAVKKK